MEIVTAAQMSPQEMYDRLWDATVLAPRDEATFFHVEKPAPHLKRLPMIDLKFGNPVKQPFSAYKVDLTVGDKPLRLQGPPMCVPFGYSTYKAARGDTNSVELDFSHRRALEDTEDFFRTIRWLDFHVLHQAITDRDKWLPGVKKSHYKDDDMYKLFNACTRMRENKGKSYAPRLSVKIWKTSELFKDGIRLPINTDSIPKDTWLRCIIECTGIWITGEKFTVGWRLLQGMIVPPPLVPTDIPMTESTPLFV